jgi:hypothetical protein
MKAVCRLPYNPVKVLGSLLAMGLLAAMPTRAAAEGISFSNQLDRTIIVQGTSFVQNMARSGPPFTVMPGRVGWDLRLPPGVRWITIFDANTRRPLHREQILFSGQDIHLRVQTAGAGLRLVPTKPPTPDSP